MKRKEYNVTLWDFQIERKWRGYHVPTYLNPVQELKVRLTEEEFDSQTLTVEHIIRTFRKRTEYKLRHFYYGIN